MSSVATLPAAPLSIEPAQSLAVDHAPVLDLRPLDGPQADFQPLELKDIRSGRKPAPENLVIAKPLSAWGTRLKTSLYFSIWRRRELWNYSYNFGETGAKYVRKLFAKSEREKINDLRTGRLSYAVFRKLPTASFFFPYPSAHADLHSGMDPRGFRHFDMIVSGLLFLAGAEIRRRYQNAAAQPVRTLVSAPTEPQIGDRDGSDMHLRFHQSTVEKGLPDPTKPAAGEETCIFKAYAAVRNRRKIPIYVLPVREIVARFESHERDWLIEHLERPVYQKIGPHFDNNDAASMTEGQPVLRRGIDDTDWVMSYDPDRVWTDDENAKRALRRLRAAIVKARRDAIEVVLDRRDVLIVDNLRAMVARREFYPTSFGEALRAWLFTKPRWMRMYYGFPLPGARLRLK
ncbi:MAG: hypothetical protein AAFY84_06180 [Pseudomonadota bacterium]